MNRTATALLVAAALAALAVVLFFANRGKSAPLPVGAPLFAFNPDEITQIKIFHYFAQQNCDRDQATVGLIEQYSVAGLL